ncbi:hypothetical protein [Reticulibacter mediterranei]|uniref:hypothetical protein n=1 Tax=Reticulibacter mediterranei TaxID=2778369 RepID=UPI001C68A4D7|nr:hypothetical protein [Reticulibacter mediterranei]
MAGAKACPRPPPGRAMRHLGEDKPSPLPYTGSAHHSIYRMKLDNVVVERFIAGHSFRDTFRDKSLDYDI